MVRPLRSAEEHLDVSLQVDSVVLFAYQYEEQSVLIPAKPQITLYRFFRTSTSCYHLIFTSARITRFSVNGAVIQF